MAGEWARRFGVWVAAASALLPASACRRAVAIAHVEVSGTTVAAFSEMTVSVEMDVGGAAQSSFTETRFSPDGGAIGLPARFIVEIRGIVAGDVRICVSPRTTPPLDPPRLCDSHRMEPGDDWIDFSIDLDSTCDGEKLQAMLGEECDGADLGGVSDCTSIGFAGGIIAGCLEDCTFDTSGCAGPPAPVPLAPEDGARTCARPTLSWMDPIGGGITYTLELSTDPTFATGTTVPGLTMPSFQPATPLPLPTPAMPLGLAGVEYFWRVTNCVSAGDCSAPSPARSFEVRRDCRDLNADGFADLVVGAPDADVGGSDAGKATVYFGRPGGPELIPEAELTPSAAGGRFGLVVAMAGDLDGDGFADLAVAAPENANGLGRVLVYFGGAGGTFDPIAEASIDGTATGGRFGAALASGDLDGDRYDDLVVGAPGALGGDGEIRVYLGGAGPGFDPIADLTIAGNAGTIEELGTAVAVAADANGDQFGDLVAGAPGDGTGSARLYFGAGVLDGVPEATLAAGGSFERIGAAVATGDIDGDFYSDIVVGAPGPADASGCTTSAGTAGRVLVFRGVASTPFDQTADATLDGPDLPLFGTTVAAADVDDDGNDELLAGLPDVGVLVYDDPFAAMPAPFLLPPQMLSDCYGRIVASSGDIDGDGVDDFVVSDPYGNVAGIGDDTGRVFLFMGATVSPGGPTGSISGTVIDDHFGLSVAWAWLALDCRG